MSSLEVVLTLIGGPTVLIEMSGLRILTDPTFDPPGEYDSSGIVLKKTAGPSVSAEAVGAVDAVLLSHDQHFDNLDRAGKAFLTQAKTTFTTPVGAGRLGHNAKGLAPWESATIENQAGQHLSVSHCVRGLGQGAGALSPNHGQQ